MRKLLVLFVFFQLGIATAKPAERIISLAPHITELVYAAGAGEKLVAVSAFSDFPSQTNSLARVADSHGLNIEAIIELKPDLILAWSGGNPNQQLQQLEDLGYKVVRVEIKRIKQLPSAIEQIGKYANTSAQANKAAQAFRLQFADIQRRYAANPRYKVFYQIASQPIMTISKKSIINEVIEVCGGNNIFQNSAALTPQVNREAILELQPDIILGDKSTLLHTNWTALSNLNATKTERIIPVQSDYLVRPGPRILAGIEQVCAIFAEA